ncbi:MAG: hypothetical protein A3H52_03190 [Candidatus Zambryskibacteria bacterium RIFCSPLOWO2_02_FULL_39_26]|uniref:Uncharacterized protein n=1 Tax=Candidatus Zambryskibacteria bacterium RIFCSPLOWO2_12_FULL_39_23 TaxID=1802776 RepID=A0A1G2USC3_9BACT|nr:MAG: hypothetical protein A2W51_00440 [Candidatus Zambryskibacteria bacterium RIFCSPHIGHO2_02_39_10]OHA99203.1 MAG: hypothetical protein A3E59_02040 [Candidatus Zambryskibacteria bacterium RIFCSPHIGHO2_12_FULL_39_47]OHB09632.1 MAG: hypothetical protein A3H52_03190 [Candidatus Zambryskibacteria bacterium RIFCSPLOWO2_02_FULL_39_26]OHB12279.1 MAG: hypothetical protein A3G99_00765 [Candidatus Zambryskibacteria bacterium RIFCSPLOWO2_12_FULL_39_23]OHB92903.1 MAG: hypothetical protein A2Z57_11770 [
MIKKFKISYIVFILSVLSIILLALNFFSIGMTIVGLWDFSKYYIPIIISLLLVDRLLNKNINTKYFKMSIILNLVYIVIILVEVINFHY